MGMELDEGIWNPIWIAVGQAFQICSALVKCACKQVVRSDVTVTRRASRVYLSMIIDETVSESL